MNLRVIRIIKWFLISIFTAIILAFMAGVALFVYYAKDAPEIEDSKLNSKPSTVIYDKDGNVMADLSIEKRELAVTKDIPLELVDAITSIEDHRFFKHRGVDPYRIVSSVIHNTQNDTMQGGSTLTQQLIKLSFFSTKSEDATIQRKAQEAWMAVNLERQNTKEEIITYYINKTYLGNGYYGMQTAAENYFGKDLKSLNLAQIALLAGMPQAPVTYDPYIQYARLTPDSKYVPQYDLQPEELQKLEASTDPDKIISNPRAKERRDMVLRSMYKYEKISEKEMNDALAKPIEDGLQPKPTSKAIPLYLDNYIKQVIQQVEEKTDLDIYKAGLKIYTPLDNAAQQRLWDIFNTDQYVKYPDDLFQVASTIVDVDTGAVVAQLGGRKQPTDITFGTNQAVETNRDWGSTMKTITDYAPAYEYGIYKSTGDIIADTWYLYPGTAIPVYDWDMLYQGNITIRKAIWGSRNIPAVKTLEAIGLDRAQGFLEGIGIKYSPFIEFSNAISSNNRGQGSEWGASSEKMAAAYASLSAGGIYTQPYYVNKIVDAEGKETDLKPTRTRAMKATTAYVVTDMLKGVLTNGTMTNGVIPDLHQAGKTGTSNYDDTQYDMAMADVVAKVETDGYYDGSSLAPDENFVGYTPKYSMAVWTGYNNRLTPVWGAKLYLALDVYREMMTYLASTTDNPDWTMPEGIEKVGNELQIMN
ncbi:penicillin-binding protein 1A [Lactococcus hodotermopsidis]|uniref:Penicillin-binding protein 1A n=1 Tax=Pseudolactococcus hodotermopsidis TaxID=2709157 RepID=A0A6A0BCY1_9LACT|nr:transglycosylase domain-containing protein [Lactococcus hodotermopsidis]GFH42218.1 penicillin-binding protein 1A [Lactococcus hodotermopsidis]